MLSVDKQQDNLLLFNNYVNNNNSSPSIVKPDISIFTPTPENSSSWSISNWFSFFSKYETEEDEYLEYMDYIDYFYQLGNDTDDWEDDVFQEVFDDDEFKRYYQAKEDERREVLMKSFVEWKKDKTSITQTPRWLNFKKGTYKSLNSYKRFKRAYAKKFQQRPLTLPRMSCPKSMIIVDDNNNKIKEIMLEFKRIQHNLTEQQLEDLIKYILKELPKLDLKSLVIPLQKSLTSYVDDHEHLESLKKCEVNAKNGFDMHVEMLDSFVNERECIASTVELMGGMNDELLARFRLKQVDSN
ncbi:FF domain-containing protein [Entamoeba marina]